MVVSNATAGLFSLRAGGTTEMPPGFTTTRSHANASGLAGSTSTLLPPFGCVGINGFVVVVRGTVDVEGFVRVVVGAYVGVAGADFVDVEVVGVGFEVVGVVTASSDAVSTGRGVVGAVVVDCCEVVGAGAVVVV